MSAPALTGGEPTPAPLVLPDEVRAYLRSQPDALLVSWLELSPQAHDALTDRERQHALGLLADRGEPGSTADYRTAQAAHYVRERLIGGDHVQARDRAALAVGATVTIDRLRYTVAHRGERCVYLRGERNGRLQLVEPITAGACWSAWRGGLRPGARLMTLRRQPDGSFVSAR